MHCTTRLAYYFASTEFVSLTDRCNNILYIRGIEEEEEDGEMKE